jgi:oligopeptide transport system substrate-binding protein
MRFHLRPDAKWSDGKTVVAEDFAYAWRRVLRPETGSRSATNLYALKNGELFNKGKLKATARDVSVAVAGGSGEAGKLEAHTAVVVLGRSPSTIATAVAPLPAIPAGAAMTRTKEDPKRGSPEEIVAGGTLRRAKPDNGWKGTEVELVGAGPVVACDGEADRWFEVRRADGATGFLPGCLLGDSPAKNARLFVERFDGRPTFRPHAPPSDDEEEDEADKPAPLRGMIAESDVVEDDSVVGVRATDDRTLDVEFEHPAPYFTDLTSYATLMPVRRDVVEPFEKRGEPDLWFRRENIVTNGPYQLDDWKFRYEITMKANPHYWNERALAIRRIVWLEVEEYNATLNLYKSGDIDYIGDNLALPLEYIPLLKKKKDFLGSDYLAIYFYELNTRVPPLDDVRIRRALDLAIDKKLLVESVIKGGQTPATHYVPEATGLGYSDLAAQERAAGTDPFHGPEAEYNPDLARKLLAEAGHPVTGQAESRRAEAFPPLEILYNTSESHKQVAVAIQDMWKRELGVSVALRNEEWKVMLKNYRDGHFQVMRFGQVADYNHASTFLDLFLSGNPQNQTGWADAEFEKLMHQAARATDRTESTRLYRKAERVAVAGMSRIPLYFYTKLNLVKPWVKGFLPNARNEHLVQYLSIDPHWEQGGTVAPGSGPPELLPAGRLPPEGEPEP